MKIKIPKGKKIIVFTGPESSGKTTCAKRVSHQFQIPLVEEYAREYLTKNGAKYTFNDVQKMMTEQVKMEQQVYSNNAIIICDTDILTYEIWVKEKFGIELQSDDQNLDDKHYLLCYPDIPWEEDPLRENPTDRLRLFKLYEERILKKKASYHTLREKDRIYLEVEF